MYVKYFQFEVGGEGGEGEVWEDGDQPGEEHAARLLQDAGRLQQVDEWSFLDKIGK